MKTLISIAVLFMMCLLFSCKSDTGREQIGKAIQITEDEMTDDSGAKSIFYNMYLPVEMASVFEQVGAVYRPGILNPPNNADRYSGSYKMAMNLGVYGVDLSYTKMFGEAQKSIEYIAAINDISRHLGIPGDLLTSALDNLEDNIANQDSVSANANRIYKKADKYLRESDREYAAAMIVLGGWVEAMYIAGNIFNRDPDNPEIMERIALQKYSLNNLISLLSNHQSEISVSKYILMLKILKDEFDKFEILLEQEGTQVDTAARTISTSGYKTTATSDNIKEISKIIASIRADVVKL